MYLTNNEICSQKKYVYDKRRKKYFSKYFKENTYKIVEKKNKLTRNSTNKIRQNKFQHENMYKIKLLK